MCCKNGKGGNFGARVRKAFKTILQFVANPRLLLCLLVAWLITNGWSYILFAMGSWFGVGWMTAVAGAYIAFLWLPFTPEKLVTVMIALALLRWLFPGDEKTLAVLRRLHGRAKAAIKRKPEKKRQDGKADAPAPADGNGTEAGCKGAV